MSTKEKYIVPQEFEGLRLDKVLAEMVPDSGLRLRRRLCDDGRVLVNGRNRKPGYKVRTGQDIVIAEGAKAVSYEELGLKVVEKSGLFGAIYKPGGVHSASIEGKDTPSVESVLSDMFPDATPILLNRLDFLTSGLLLVAMAPEGEAEYRSLESKGMIKKFYLATVRGRLDGLVTIKKALDSDDRKKTRVLADDDKNSRRWTDVEVLSHDHENDTSEVRCLISKGARHQIRAHLAGIGHPIVGDPVYGEGESGRLMLHHQLIEFAGFRAEIQPDWA